MTWFSQEHLQHIVSSHGYLAVGLTVGLESMGLPLPGETILVLAALYASATHGLDIWGVIGAATAGAVIGDNIGYLIGRRVGYRLLLKHGPKIGIGDDKIKLGQYLFLKHGVKAVFFGRFVAVLRILAALLAGINCMCWRRFLIANALGGVIWASIFGLGAYIFGETLMAAKGPLGAAFLVAGVVALLIGLKFARSHEAQLREAAERAFPGPLQRDE
jgi:membrane protein DedA with SNARE-associated domain